MLNRGMLDLVARLLNCAGFGCVDCGGLLFDVSAGSAATTMAHGDGMIEVQLDE